MALYRLAAAVEIDDATSTPLFVKLRKTGAGDHDYRVEVEVPVFVAGVPVTQVVGADLDDTDLSDGQKTQLNTAMEDLRAFLLVQAGYELAE